MKFGEIQDISFNALRAAHDQQHIDALKHLEDASHRWASGRFSHLVGEGLPCLLQASSQLIFRQCVHQESQSHDYDQSNNAPGRLQKQAVGEEERGFQEAKTAFGVVVPLDWTDPPVGAVGPAGAIGLVRGAEGVRFLPNKSPQPTALSWRSAR